MIKVAVVVPNWNGKATLTECLNSLLNQTTQAHIIVVDNGSADGSVDFIKENYQGITVITNKKNLGFAGGVNTGIERAIKMGVSYVALFNNDAVADKDWVKQLVSALEKDDSIGIGTCKFISMDKKRIDSTGDFYTSWGLPYPRGRGELVSSNYDSEIDIFGASGGASIYRIKMLVSIGLFDSDFFAYYEDIDLSFRAQLSGWKVVYAPDAIAYHSIGATSSKLRGFTTYQTMKNLPWILCKDVPFKLLPTILPRFFIAYAAFAVSSVKRKEGRFAIKGALICLLMGPKKIIQRWGIQHKSTVSANYIRQLLVYDLPPNAKKLRTLREKWWRLSRRKSI